MGVDANYIYGYMCKLDEVEWDIEYLKNTLDLDKNLKDFLKEYTYRDLVKWLEEDDVDDWDDIAGELKFQMGFVYDEHYLYFTHRDLIKRYPDRQLKEMDDLAKEYAQSIGIKNYDDFKWDEFGFFD